MNIRWLKDYKNIRHIEYSSKAQKHQWPKRGRRSLKHIENYYSIRKACYLIPSLGSVAVERPMLQSYICQSYKCQQLFHSRWILFVKLFKHIFFFFFWNLWLLEGYKGEARAPHSSTLAWKIPWMEEPGGLLSMGSHRVRHDWSDLAAATRCLWVSEVTQSCPILCNPMDCSLSGSSIHGIFQVTVLEWVAISSSRVSSRPRDRTRISLIVDGRFTIWATREVCLGTMKEK